MVSAQRSGDPELRRPQRRTTVLAEQATDQVLYTGQPGQLNSDDPGLEVNPDHFGLTNAQLQDMFGSSFGGVLTTEDAVDMVDDGIIGPIGVAASDPGLLPDPDDPFVATPQGREDLFDAIAELQTLTQAEVDVLYASENAPGTTRSRAHRKSACDE